MRRTVGVVSVLTAGAMVIGGCTTTEKPADPGYPSVPAYSSSSAAPSSSAVPLAAGCISVEAGKMSTRQKLAQMLMVGVKDAADAKAVVKKERIGGIFVGSWTEKSILTSGAAKSLSSGKVPTMVSVDMEGGRVSRLKSIGIDLPPARELASTKSATQVRQLAYDVGVKMRNLGVTVDFAPDIDVSDQPADSVIGDRSYSADPITVARYGRAFAAGLRDAGVLPVFKHFPGHGHGSGDSHTGTVKTPPLSDLVDNDLIPFRTLLPMKGTAAMVGHLIVPGLTGPDTPASISPAAIQMLRTGEGYNGPAFNGVIFSDDLSGMAAITEKYPITQAAPMALAAGSDIALWLTTDKVTAVLDALEKAVANNKLSMDHVNAAVNRILAAKRLKRC
ncbi:MAG: glycoside hydrolase family 3 N-terminal domain-containing protein [Gordonia sp. (in: high G+C Gram-positive bacteria)]|uniref:glycoside hydrolase family 3 N-terminal domain-containing protein n=1 Tax=Gordonia sp. (in: high G+C Gram-positive bacteria) TaxID=84139 RepID=UPI0039E26D73